MHQTILPTNCDQPFESLSHLYKSDNQPNLKNNKLKQQYQRFKLWQINPTTFDIFRHMRNLFPIRIIHHGQFKIEGMRYANDVQYVRSKQGFIISKYILRPLSRSIWWLFGMHLKYMFDELGSTSQKKGEYTVKQ